MNKYVVAFWSDHTGELLQEIVEANSEVEAAVSYLDIAELEFDSMDLIHTYCANCDTSINVIQIDKNNWKNFTTGGPAHAAAAVH